MSEEKEMFEFLEDRGLFNYLYDEPTEPLNIKVCSTDTAYPANLTNNAKRIKPNIIWRLLLHFFGQESYKDRLGTTGFIVVAFFASLICTVMSDNKSGALGWLILGLADALYGFATFLLLFGDKIALSKAEKILGISNNQNVYVVTFYSVEKAKLTGVDYKDNDELIFRCDYELNATTHDHWFSTQEVFLGKADAYAKYSAQFEKRVSVLCDVLNIDRSRAEKFLLSAAFAEYAKVKFQYGNSVAYYQNGTSDDFFMNEKDVFDCLKEMKKKDEEIQKEADRQKNSREDAVQTFNQMFSDE